MTDKEDNDICTNTLLMTVFKLETKLNFGKYKGETIQEIIDDGNAEYLEWCMDNIEWFELDDNAGKLVDSILYPDHLTDYSWHESFIR